MTVLIKHGADDYRLYLRDGTQLGSKVEDHPNPAQMATMLEEEYPGNSMLANEKPRSVYTDIVTENVMFVDKTRGQNAPWEAVSE